MEWQYTPYTLPLALSAAGSFTLALFTLRNRHTPGAVSFSALMVAVAAWTAAYTLEMASVSLAAKIAFSRLFYLGVVSVPALWLVFALQNTGRWGRVGWRATAILVAELDVGSAPPSAPG